MRSAAGGNVPRMDEPRYHDWVELDTRTSEWAHVAGKYRMPVLLRRNGPDGHIHVVPAIDGDMHLLGGACFCLPRSAKAKSGRTRIVHRSPIQRLTVPGALPASL